MDYTVSTYRRLLDTLHRQGFSFQSFCKFPESQEKKVIILRHDVDLLPLNSLNFAKIEAEKGIKGSYYFRIVPESFDERIIKEIHLLGHEVGYHYEDVARCAVRGLRHAAGRRSPVAGNQSQNSLREEEVVAKLAIESFKENLKKLREIAPVKTICMHGSPMSRWDSRLLWKYYDYHDYGIVGEPYFDINFDEVLYLTDTGRRWDGDSSNIRDKALGSRLKAEGQKDLESKRRIDEEIAEKLDEPNQRRAQQSQISQSETMKRHSVSQSHSPSVNSSLPPSALRPAPSSFHSTFDIIKAAEKGELPNKIMMTFHPQRWTDKPAPWVKELIWQNIKNIGKYFIVKMSS